MAVSLVTTPGASNANAYEEIADAQAYWDTRVGSAIADAWNNADDKGALLVLATRMFDKMLQPHTSLEERNGVQYYITTPTLIGSPATTTQRLMFPRVGLLDRNGNAIASTIIPDDLKEVVAEFAGQLAKSDRLADSDIASQGLTSFTAGPVSFDFKNTPMLRVLPDIVFQMLPQSWLTNETIAPAIPFVLDLL